MDDVEPLMVPQSIMATTFLYYKYQTEDAIESNFSSCIMCFLSEDLEEQ